MLKIEWLLTGMKKYIYIFILCVYRYRYQLTAVKRCPRNTIRLVVTKLLAVALIRQYHWRWHRIRCQFTGLATISVTDDMCRVITAFVSSRSWARPKRSDIAVAFRPIGLLIEPYSEIAKQPVIRLIGEQR